MTRKVEKWNVFLTFLNGNTYTGFGKSLMWGERFSMAFWASGLVFLGWELAITFVCFLFGGLGGGWNSALPKLLFFLKLLDLLSIHLFLLTTCPTSSAGKTALFIWLLEDELWKLFVLHVLFVLGLEYNACFTLLFLLLKIGTRAQEEVFSTTTIKKVQVSFLKYDSGKNEKTQPKGILKVLLLTESLNNSLFVGKSWKHWHWRLFLSQSFSKVSKFPSC